MPRKSKRQKLDERNGNIRLERWDKEGDLKVGDVVSFRDQLNDFRAGPIHGFSSSESGQVVVTIWDDQKGGFRDSYIEDVTVGMKKTRRKKSKE